jgi:hypothetical protein
MPNSGENEIMTELVSRFQVGVFDHVQLSKVGLIRSLLNATSKLLFADSPCMSEPGKIGDMILAESMVNNGTGNRRVGMIVG